MTAKLTPLSKIPERARAREAEARRISRTYRFRVMLYDAVVGRLATRKAAVAFAKESDVFRATKGLYVWTHVEEWSQETTWRWKPVRK